MNSHSISQSAEHALNAGRAVARVIDARHCGEAVWWAGIARRHAMAAKIAARDEWSAS